MKAFIEWDKGNNCAVFKNAAGDVDRLTAEEMERDYWKYVEAGRSGKNVETKLSREQIALAMAASPRKIYG